MQFTYRTAAVFITVVLALCLAVPVGGAVLSDVDAGAASSVAAADTEPNDTIANATSVTEGRYDGEITVGDDDYYAVELDAGDTLSVATEFSNAAGNLDLEAARYTSGDGRLDYDDAQHRTSTTNNDNEQLAFTAERNGTYYIHVYGRDEDSTSATYTLVLDRKTPSENDDSEPTYSIESADNITEGRYDRQITRGDEDYYAIDLDAGDTLSVAAEFSNAAGNLDLEVARYTSGDGQLDYDDAQHRTSTTNNDNEQLALTAEQTGTYYIHIEGRNQDTTSAAYTLVIDRKTPAENDDSEPTHSIESADNITEGRYDRQITRGDEDYYAIDLEAGDTLSVAAQFSNAAGNLDLEVARYTSGDGQLDYDDAQHRTSTTNTDNEQLALTATRNATYYIHVDGRDQDTTSAAYTLVVDRKTPSENDGSEPTYSIESADNITEGRYDRQITRGDEDYYAIDLDAGDTLSVAAEFSNAAGNLDLEVARYTSGDGRLDYDDAQHRTSTTNTDNEQLALTATRNATYYIHVDGRDQDTTSAAYTLVIDRKTPAENDGSEPTYSIESADNLTEGRYDRQITRGDEDYYAVDLDAGDTLSVAAEFSNSAGNLDLEVARYTSGDGRLDYDDAQHRTSTTNTDNEQLALTATRNATYYIHVDGRHQDTTSAAYTLLVDRKTPSENDGSEPTYSLESAAPVTDGQYDRQITRGDEDYYVIALEAGDTLSVAAEFSNSAGNLDLEVARYTSGDGRLDYDDAQHRTSTSNTDNERLTITAEQTGFYYVHVDGRHQDTTSAAYTLDVNVTETTPRIDAETATTAFENGSILVTTTVTNRGSAASDRVTLDVDSVAGQWRVEKHTATAGLWSADISWEFDSFAAGATETTRLLLSPRTETRSPPRFGTVIARNASTRLDAETALLWVDGSSGDSGGDTGSLTVTATDEHGEPTANVGVKLVTDDWSTVVGRATTAGDGTATFTGLDPARYNLELTGPNGSYWGPGTADVGSNGTAVTVQRPEPYHVRTVLTDRTNGDGVYRVGERINLAPLVKNNGSYVNNRSTRVRIAVDTDGDGAADVVRTRGGRNATVIPEDGTQWYGYDFVPSTTGTKAVNVTTQAYINGDWVTTDVTGWATEFTVDPAGDAPPAEFRVSLPPERDGDDLVFTGRLVDPATGAGIAGEEVSLMDEDNLLADDLNFADNELANATTNATGHFTVRWTARQLDGVNPDNYVQTYLEYEGSDATTDLRYPASEQYLIQVAPSVAALDYGVWTATQTVVEQRGTNATVELFVGETGGFTPIEAIPQDYYAMPNIDVRVEGLPSDAYTVSPRSHELLTVLALPYQTYPEPTFGANLTVDTDELASGTHEATVVTRTEGGTMVRQQNVTVEVVEDTTDGQRAVVYNTAKRTITPRWWYDQARNKALSVAFRDPVAYTVDKTTGVAKSFASGPGSMIKETVSLLADVYENRLQPSLTANSRATVGEYLRTGAADSGTNVTAVRANMSAIPDLVERGENATAERTTNATLERVRAWKAAVNATGDDTTERATAVAALNATETLLERDAAMLAESGTDTEARLNVTVSPATLTTDGPQTVTVTVTDAASGAAVSGATVELAGAGSRSVTDTGSTGVAEFSVSYDNATTVTVSVSAEGYANVSTTVPVEAPGDTGVVVVGSTPSTDGDGRFAGDGLHQDVNGDGSVSLADVTTVFTNYNSDAVQNNPTLFDYNGDGRVTLADVTTLFGQAAG